MYDAEVVAVNGYKQECLANNATNPEFCDYFDTDYAYLASYEAYIEHNGYTTDGDEALGLLADYEEEDYYKMTINGEERLFIVLKDSERMKNPEYISSDLVTDVSISSKSTKVPLDTLVGAEELTSGEEYDRVLNKLRYTKGVTFDLSLYSKSLQDYITKLDDTTFKVSIPIPSELEGKKLTVYYVAKDGTLEEHEVTVEGGYATFITNHFSVYSLVDKDSINPDTGDNISLYIALMLFSVIGLVGIKYFKKNN